MSVLMACQLLSSLCPSELQEVIDSFDIVLTDCDGVLWYGNSPLPSAAETLNKLREMGKKVYFVTNNSSKTREEYVKKCNLLGFKAEMHEIISTAYLTATYLQAIGFKKKAYVVGSASLEQELDSAGINCFGSGRDPMPSKMVAWVESGVELDPDVGAVVVGFDDYITYAKILKAASYLKHPECLFLATNTDPYMPYNDKITVPGTGAIVAAVQTAAGREPIVLGKPHKYICEALEQENNINPKRTIMFGDRADTDILLGKNCGFQTLCVLSGVTSQADLEKWSKSSCEEERRLVADFYLLQLGDMLPLLQSLN